MKAHGTSSSIALCLAVLASCEEADQSCTAAGCSDGFGVFLVADEPLREGSYEVEVTMDGGPETCRFVVPGGPSGAEPVCSDSTRLRAFASIHDNGAAPDPDAPNAIIVDVFVASTTAVLEVRHDAAPLFEQTFRPTYQTIAPNGPECGPICELAPPQQVTLAYE